MKFSKKVTISLGVAILVFVVTMIVLFAKFQTVPDTLIVSFFTFVGAEGGALAWIKTTDTRHGADQKEDDP